MNEQKHCFYEFESFRIDALKRQLAREGGEIVPLTSKAFETLLFLVHHRGLTVSKDELMDAIWTDVAVEENNLTQQISTLRKALGEQSGKYKFIITVPGRGYSFVAPVKESFRVETESDFLLQEITHSSITIDVDDNHKAAETRRREDENSQAFNKPLRAVYSRSRIGNFVFAAILLILGITAFAWLYTQNAARSGSSGPKSVAVLPFKLLNPGGTSSDDFLGTGMSDTLIAKLGNVQSLNVRPTSQIIKYANQNPDVLAAGRELKADVILEGTIQRNGDGVRVNVQLLDVQTGKVLWGQSFDEKFSNIFTLQDAISADVVRVLQVKLSNEEQKDIHKHSTENLEAYQAYLRGRYFWNKRDKESLKKGIVHFEQAVRLDPNYALAFSGMADSYLVLDYYFGETGREENLQNARQSAQKAVELDDSLAEAHTSLAFIYAFPEDKSSLTIEHAEREFKRAIELNPNYATTHHWYSDFLAINGRDEESMKEITEAVRLDPLSSIINTTLGERLFYAHRYDEAINQLRLTIEMNDQFAAAHYFLAMAYEQKKMFDESVNEAQKACALTKLDDFDAALAHIYAVSGKRTEAEKILSGLINRSAQPHTIAIVYAGLSDHDRTLKWLDRLDKTKAHWFLKSDPRLDALRARPEFQSLIAK